MKNLNYLKISKYLLVILVIFIMLLAFAFLLYIPSRASKIDLVEGSDMNFMSGIIKTDLVNGYSVNYTTKSYTSSGLTMGTTAVGKTGNDAFYIRASVYNDAQFIGEVSGLEKEEFYTIKAWMKVNSIEIETDTTNFGASLSKYYSWAVSAGSRTTVNTTWEQIACDIQSDINGKLKFSLRLGGWSECAKGEVLFDDIIITKSSNDDTRCVYSSDDNLVKMVLAKDDVNISGVTTDDMKKWLNKVSEARVALDKFTGLSYNNGKVSIVGTHKYSAYAYAGYPIEWMKQWVPEVLSNIHNRDEFPFFLMHELGHNYHGWNNNIWDFDTEFWGTTLAAYVNYELNSTMYMNRVKYVGKDFKKYFKINYDTKSPLEGDGFTYILLEIRDGLTTDTYDGWNAFKEVFAYFNSLDSTHCPSTDEGKFKLFITKLQEFSDSSLLQILNNNNLNGSQMLKAVAQRYSTDFTISIDKINLDKTIFFPGNEIKISGNMNVTSALGVKSSINLSNSNVSITGLDTTKIGKQNINIMYDGICISKEIEIYNSTNFGYTVEYYKDDLTAQNKIFTTNPSSKAYGTKLTDTIIANDYGADWINAKKPENYKNGAVQEYITIGTTNNIVKVLYLKMDFEYAIEYYKDDLTAQNKIFTTNPSSKVYGTALTDTIIANDYGADWINAKKPENYGDGAVQEYITIGTTNNIVKVLYLEEISSSKYNISNNIINRVSPNTSKETFLSNIVTSKNPIIYSQDNKEILLTDTVKTGMKLTFDNKTFYILIVTGDLNGDGLCNLVDLSKIKLHIVSLQKITGNYLKAADVNNDGELSLIDLSLIKLYNINLRNF